LNLSAMKIFKGTPGKDGPGPVETSLAAAEWGLQKKARNASSTPGLPEDAGRPEEGLNLGEERRRVADAKLTEALSQRARSAGAEAAFRIQREPEPENRTGLPDRLKAGVEGMSGISLGDVKVHYNSSQPARVQAWAYTKGTDIYMGPGQERYLPHEAWHVVQQKQGRVQPTIQKQSTSPLNEDESLEQEADVMGARAAQADFADAPVETLADLGAPGEAPIQRKKTIEGSQHFARKGELAINMEERLRGSAGGAYGIIRFTPYVNEGTDAKKIDLVQIASMTTNKRGQARYRKEEIDDGVVEDHSETSGTPAVKDLWRIGGDKRHHMDLTGDKLAPRTSVEDPNVEDAYNSERRYGQWKDPLDEVTMGARGGPVLDNFHAKRALNTSTFKVRQEPGFRNGREIQPAELHDFPSGPEPAAFSFHTTVDADGEPWGTVKWGFSTVLNGSEEIEIDAVEGPTFEAGQSEEMTQARRQFDMIMANSRSWSSPEALRDAKEDLKSEEDYERGQNNLFDMADTLLDVFTRLDLIKDGALFKRFALPHLKLADEVLDLMHANEMSEAHLFVQLSAAWKEMSARFNES
jgi:hypothetical protein